MEAGENPARSRHCKEGALSMMPLHEAGNGGVGRRTEC